MKLLNHNNKRVILTCTLCAIFSAGCCNKSNNNQPKREKFYYHYWDKDRVKKDTIRRLTLSESINVIGVLTYYGIDLDVRSGNIYIPDTVFHDTMFIYSISQKSLDSLWLSTHVWVK